MDKARSFLQSEAWGEVQAAYGREIKWVTQGATSVLAVKHRLPFQQSYWFIPHGPYVDGLNDGAVFVRYEPILPLGHDRKVPDVHPSQTLLTPLKTEEIILGNMKQKCRYNLRLAEKKGVTVHIQSDVKKFYSLLHSTAQQQQIRLHPQAYYETMVRVLGKQNMVKLYFAYYHTQPIAVALVVYYGDTVTYLHGGSDYNQRAVMAPYLLHWQVMKDALAAGYKHYDWFGVSEQWPGVTKFKMGFGGTVVSRPGTFERALRPLWYTGFRLMKPIWIS